MSSLHFKQICNDTCPTSRGPQSASVSFHVGDQNSYLWALASYILPSESILQEASCQFTCAGRFAVAMVALGIMVLINGALSRLLPSLIDNLLKSAAMICMLLANGWIWLPMQRLSLIQGAISLISFVIVHSFFLFTRARLQERGVPTTSEVNSCVAFLDTAISTIDASFLIIPAASL